MFVVVAYDVSDKRTLRRVMKMMVNYGVRRQKSVFECELTEKRFVELRSRISSLVDEETDRVCYYHLCASCKKKIEGITKYEHDVPKQEAYVIV